jgi:xylulokinase
MDDKYLVGVDLGTSAIKATLCRPDGTMMAEASADILIYYPKPGFIDQENDDFYFTAAQKVRQCLSVSWVEPRAVAGCKVFFNERIG